MIKLSIIIVNYNSFDYLRDCIISLDKINISGEFEVIIYDNGDIDPRIDSLKNRNPGIEILSAKRNVSYSAANNRGSERSRGEMLLFLNPDTIVLEGAVEKLLEFLHKTPDCGAVGPRLVDRKGTIEFSSVSEPGILSEVYLKLVKKLPPFLKYRIFRPAETRQTDAISGAAIMIRREVFEKAGGFDESFPLYFEDFDLCSRIRALGWKICYYPDAEIIHFIGSAGGVKKEKPKRNNLGQSEIKYRVGQLRYYRKHKGLIQNLLLKLYLYLKFGRDRRLFESHRGQ